MEKEYRNGSHDSCENVKGCGETKAKDLELPDPFSGDKPEIGPIVRMHRNLKVSVLQVYRAHPISRVDGTQD